MNPFAVLKISATASRQEVVAKSQELMEEVQDKELQLQYRKAVEAIISHPFERLVQTVWEMPNTDYDAEQMNWQRFAKAHQINPVTTNDLRQAVDGFVTKNFQPDDLMELVLKMVKASTPSTDQVVSLGAVSMSELAIPFSISDLF